MEIRLIENHIFKFCLKVVTSWRKNYGRIIECKKDILKRTFEISCINNNVKWNWKSLFFAFFTNCHIVQVNNLYLSYK